MKARTVYPVEGHYLNDIPAVEHECSDPRCVDSGAFTDKPPPKKAAAKNEDPASAGSLDSEEK